MNFFHDYAWGQGFAVVYALTGGGKTTACLQIARDFAAEGKNVLMVSEDDHKRLRGRLFQSQAVFGKPETGRVHIHRFRDDDDLGILDARHVYSGIGLYIVDTCLLGPNQIRRIISMAKHRDTPLVLTCSARPRIGGDAIPIPTKMSYDAHAIFGVEGGTITVKKHRMKTAGGHIRLMER
jgi:hypothetical protein